MSRHTDSDEKSNEKELEIGKYDELSNERNQAKIICNITKENKSEFFI